MPHAWKKVAGFKKARRADKSIKNARQAKGLASLCKRVQNDARDTAIRNYSGHRKWLNRVWSGARTKSKHKKWKKVVGANKYHTVKTNTNGSGLCIATINVRGINNPVKRYEVERWAKWARVDVLCITETKHAHTSEEGNEDSYVEETEQIRGGFKWFFSTSVSPKTHETIKKHKESGKKVAPELRVRATETRGVGVLISNEWVDKINQ